MTEYCLIVLLFLFAVAAILHWIGWPIWPILPGVVLWVVAWNLISAIIDWFRERRNKRQP